MNSFNRLFKKTNTKAIQYWDIFVYEDPDYSTAYIIRTEYGQVDTSNPQVTHDTVWKGKNVGKKNETTAHEQAIKDAQAKWEKQKKKGYVETIKDAENDVLDEIIEGGIVPMLAQAFTKHGHKISYPCFVQPKLDGVRCIAIVKDGVCTLWSRTRKPITSVPHIVTEIEKHFKADVVLDGELFNKSTNIIPYKKFIIKNKEILIDKDDIFKLKDYSLQISTDGYPVVSIERKLKYIHRLVMNEPKEDVDHINGNKLDNRKENLRLATPSQNLANSDKRITNTSGYKGVMFFKRDNNWHAQITKNYKKIHIGYFNTAIEAATAYDKVAKELFGEFAKLNFPEQNKLKKFEDIISAVRSKKPNELSKSIEYHIYDLVNNDTFRQRAEKLWKCFNIGKPKLQYLKFVVTDICENENHVSTFFEAYRELGYEGCMLRNQDSVYVNKRSYDLQKVKEFDSEEYDIVGVEEGNGKLQGCVGSFICYSKEGGQFNVKLKGDLSYLKELWNNEKLWYNKKLTVQFQGLTNYNVPRFPIGIAIRDYE